MTINSGYTTCMDLKHGTPCKGDTVRIKEVWKECEDVTTGLSAHFKVGDWCPKCHWILTILDFRHGRCGHCGFHDLEQS